HRDHRAELVPELERGRQVPLGGEVLRPRPLVGEGGAVEIVRPEAVPRLLRPLTCGDLVIEVLLPPALLLLVLGVGPLLGQCEHIGTGLVVGEPGAGHRHRQHPQHHQQGPPGHRPLAQPPELGPEQVHAAAPSPLAPAVTGCATPTSRGCPGTGTVPVSSRNTDSRSTDTGVSSATYRSWAASVRVIWAGWSMPCTTM